MHIAITVRRNRSGEHVRATAEALRLNPENAWAYNSYAWHLAQQGDYVTAEAQIVKAIALEPESFLLVDTRAHVLMGMGEVPAAENAFTRAMELGGPDIVREYQKSLIAKGYAPGRSDGVVDAVTQAALSACIRDNCRLLLD
jgi:Tfp pilus assembly protein PilF